jgi:hypothetical protein
VETGRENSIKEKAEGSKQKAEGQKDRRTGARSQKPEGIAGLSFSCF